jgi:hypothetical protein
MVVGIVQWEVLFPKSYRRKLWAYLIHIGIRPISDSFGAVLSGFIRMRGPLCSAVATHSTHHVDQESPKTLRLLGSGVNIGNIECFDLVFDEVNEAETIEDGAEQHNHLVMFGVMQGDNTSYRQFKGIYYG